MANKGELAADIVGLFELGEASVRGLACQISAIRALAGDDEVLVGVVDNASFLADAWLDMITEEKRRLSGG